MCPVCHSSNVSSSKKWRFTDLLMAALAMKAYRCRDCRKRFYLPRSMAKNIRAQRKWLVRVHDRGSRPSAAE